MLSMKQARAFSTNRHSRALQLECLEDRAMLSADILFSAPVKFGGTGRWPVDISTLDVEADGDLDLIVRNGGPAWDYSLLINKGGGEFERGSRINAGPVAFAMTSGDLNHDGHLDLVFANKSEASSNLSVMLGQGDGSFEPRVVYSVALNPTSLVAVDLNGDGRLDLAASGLSDVASVRIGIGDGTFDREVRYSVGTSPRHLIAEDFNGDGHIDLVTSNNESNDVSMLRGKGDGTFMSETRYDTHTSPGPIVAADFDADGALDLATSTAGRISILKGNGDATFLALKGIRLAAPDALAVGDVNNDGLLDLAVGHGSNSVSLLVGHGDGTFTSMGRGIRTGSYSEGVTLGDFDGDGDLDLAVTNLGLGQPAGVSVLLSQTPAAGDANRDFDFNQRDIVHVLQAAKYLTGEPASFEEGDWNVFDQLDIVAALQTGNYLKGPYALRVTDDTLTSFE